MEKWSAGAPWLMVAGGAPCSEDDDRFAAAADDNIDDDDNGKGEDNAVDDEANADAEEEALVASLRPAVVATPIPKSSWAAATAALAMRDTSIQPASHNSSRM